MFMVSCFDPGRAGAHRRVGFRTRGRLRQSVGTCNAEIDMSGKKCGKKDFALQPNRASLRSQIRPTCPKQAGDFEQH